MSARRYILGIETSNPSAGGAGVALARFVSGAIDGPVEVELLAETTRHSDDLMPAIERVCARAGVAPASIARIAVSIGPGGYTGLRMAVTTAKVLAEALGAEVVGVATAKVAACALGPDDRPALVCLASKGASAWGAVIETDGGVRPVGIVGADDLGSLGVRAVVGDAHLAREIDERAAALGLRRETVRLDPAACARLGAGMSPCDPAALEPIYAREPDAVTQWRARHG